MTHFALNPCRIWLGMVGAAMLLVCLPCVARAVPPCRYTVEMIVGPDCGPSGQSNIFVRGLNSSGVVVGSYSCPGGLPRPFRWSAATGFEPLPLPPGYTNGEAMDIADDGVIVGTTYPLASPSRGYVWDGSTFQLIGVLPGTVSSNALAINNDHEVVGYLLNGGEGWGWFAFRWEDGQLDDVSPSLSTGETQATDISNTGLITGLMAWTTAQPNGRAFILNAGNVTDLGLGLPAAFATQGMAVSDSGEACGIWWSGPSTPTGYLLRGFYWDGKRLHDLPTGSYVGAIVADMNNHSTIVGNLSEFPGTGGPGCLWEDGRKYDIWPVTDPATGIGLREVQAINDAGQIAANAVDHPLDGLGALFTPVYPDPGDTNCDGIVNVQDLIGVIRNWYRDGGREDLNDDGIVNVHDLFDVLINWG